jgi:hypothetical protein
MGKDLLNKMPKASDCPLGFFQSDERGGSHSLRNACRHCGKTKEAHEKEVNLPSDELAKRWLLIAGYRTAPYYNIALKVLTSYIEYQKGLLD